MLDGTYLSRNFATLGPMIRQPPCDRFLLAVWLMNDFHLYLLHSVINCLCLKIGSYLRSYFLSLTIINLRSVELIREQLQLTTAITRAFSRDKSLDSPLVSQCPCYQSLSTPIVIYCLSVRTISSHDHRQAWKT